jgi:acetylglutamate kinase
MQRLGKKPEFVGGMRVTDEETVEIVEMVLVGKINKEIVGLINHHGGKAVGLSGKDGQLLLARRRLHRLPSGETVDIGLVGEVERVNPEPIRLLEEHGFIPVIAPVGVGGGGETYNINADLVAGEVAAALGAEKLIHLTDVQGIKGKDGKLVSTLARKDAERLMKEGVIDGGMLPKVESSLRALEGGTAKAHIIDGRRPHAILLELFTREGIGTEIVL